MAEYNDFSENFMWQIKYCNINNIMYNLYLSDKK